MAIRITRDTTPRPQGTDLQWDEEERLAVESRILDLRPDQIGALLELTQLGFSKERIENVVAEILEQGREGIHIYVLMDEADSKENLLWWLDYFERANSGR